MNCDRDKLGPEDVFATVDGSASPLLVEDSELLHIAIYSGNDTKLSQKMMHRYKI